MQPWWARYFFSKNINKSYQPQTFEQLCTYRPNKETDAYDKEIIIIWKKSNEKGTV